MLFDGEHQKIIKKSQIIMGVSGQHTTQAHSLQWYFRKVVM